MVAKRVIFEGRVQGVGFRYAVKELARGFEICGSVRNLVDGTVELLAMGEPEEVESFVAEIAEASCVAHLIRSFRAESIPRLENVAGFRIER
jgi:acylphosphatase